MPRRRNVKYHGKNPKYKGYAITYNRYKTLEYFCADYDEYVRRYNDCLYESTPPNDGQPHGGSLGNPTESKAIMAAQYRVLTDIIEQAAIEASPDIYQDLLFALRHHGVGYNYLKTCRGMKHGKDYYYRKRDDFFCILDIFLKNKDSRYIIPW